MIQPTFFDWVRSGLDFTRPPYEACSPNLGQLRQYLDRRWPGGQDLGCEQDREIRTGGTQSEHSWGAAFDWRYPNGKGAEISTFVIDHSLELGICSIHDYLGDRIWRAGRTSNVNDAHTLWWKKQNGAGSGMGEPWADYFHFVTTFAAFHNTTPVADRLPHTPPPDPPPPPPPPDEGDDMAAIAAIYPPGPNLGVTNPKTFLLRADGGIRHAQGPDVEFANALNNKTAGTVPFFPITSEEHYRALEAQSAQP